MAPKDPTPIERIKFLLNNYWPDDRRWDAEVSESFNGSAVHMTIRSKDHTSTYARLHVLPKTDAKGYNIEVSYPGVSGSPEAVAENMDVISTLAGFLKQISRARVLRGE